MPIGLSVSKSTACGKQLRSEIALNLCTTIYNDSRWKIRRLRYRWFCDTTQIWSSLLDRMFRLHDAERCKTELRFLMFLWLILLLLLDVLLVACNTNFYLIICGFSAIFRYRSFFCIALMTKIATFGASQIRNCVTRISATTISCL